MPWAKIDDRFHSHPKVISAGDAAVGLHVRALSYCAAYLTDGRIPDTFVNKKRRSAERLVAVGLWRKDEQGFFIHDYLDFNPSKEEVLAEREEARVRMNKVRTSPEQATKFARSSPSPSRPVPSPSRPKEQKTITTTETGFVIPDQLLTLWKETYPAVDVPRMVGEAFAWSVANPQNRKSNWARFLNAWLKREQDRAPRVPAPPPPPPRAAIQDLPALPPEEAAANIRRIGEMVRQVGARKTL